MSVESLGRKRCPSMRAATGSRRDDKKREDQRRELIESAADSFKKIYAPALKELEDK